MGRWPDRSATNSGTRRSPPSPAPAQATNRGLRPSQHRPADRRDPHATDRQRTGDCQRRSATPVRLGAILTRIAATLRLDQIPAQPAQQPCLGRKRGSQTDPIRPAAPRRDRYARAYDTPMRRVQSTHPFEVPDYPNDWLEDWHERWDLLTAAVQAAPVPPMATTGGWFRVTASHLGERRRAEDFNAVFFVRCLDAFEVRRRGIVEVV